MFVRHELGYVTKRGAQVNLIDEAGAETLVYLDLVKAEDGTITGFKPKTKNAPEVEYLTANKAAVLESLIK